MRPPKRSYQTKRRNSCGVAGSEILTAIQIRTVLGADLQTTQTNFQRRLLEKIRPEQVGLVFQPVKADGLAAATGSTDFSSLFIGFSLFLIVSAALLGGIAFQT